LDPQHLKKKKVKEEMKKLGPYQFLHQFPGGIKESVLKNVNVLGKKP
jgi:hypothetical protein